MFSKKKKSCGCHKIVQSDIIRNPLAELGLLLLLYLYLLSILSIQLYDQNALIGGFNMQIFVYKNPLMHFSHIAVLTICLISINYFTNMLPQHHVYRNELNCECSNTTLARRNIAP